MFKNLYNNIISLNISYVSNKNLNLYTFLKKSTLLKNYSNYLTFYISTNNKLCLKTVITSFWKISPDIILTPLNILTIVWIVVEYVVTNV